MTLSTLLIYIAVIAIAITIGIGFWKKGHKSWFMTFLQNFTGVLFLISGWVKAVDPMGTAFKLEQYFAEFDTTFRGTWIDFAAPLFPFMAKYALLFSLVMIIFEMVLGIMLLMGHKSKLTSWLFLLLVAFFTVLTGFTFLTGYVPSGENFFSFSAWGPYNPNNMRVTDCGCFGDFIKLEPRISFFKDIFLLFPAVFFVFKHKDMHQLFSKKTRNIIVVVSTIALLFYCLNNYMWNLPHADFRPFQKGVDIAAQKIAEEDAAASVEIVAWILQNKTDGNIVELPNDVYMKEFKQYPKDKWDVIEQVKTEPSIVASKISDFEFVDGDGFAVSEDLLVDPEASFMLVCYHLKGTTTYQNLTIPDTIFRIDTIQTPEIDSFQIVKQIDRIVEKEITEEVNNWDEKYLKKWSSVKSFIDAAQNDGRKVFAVVGGASQMKMKDFAKKVGVDMPFYEADDILLKTIVRSNPGIVLWKNGVILDKWHVNKLPAFEQVKDEHFQ